VDRGNDAVNLAVQTAAVMEEVEEEMAAEGD
jgi:hypothetical protein